MSAIHTTHLDVHLGGAQILHDVSMRVNVGEVVAVMGANGSGKSTLLRACLGLLPSSSGQVHLLGQPLGPTVPRSEEHTSELQSRGHLVCRLLLEKKKIKHDSV